MILIMDHKFKNTDSDPALDPAILEEILQCLFKTLIAKRMYFPSN